MKYFDQTHRVGSDDCNKTSQLLQSEGISKYNMFNFYKTNIPECDDSVKKMQEFASDNYMHVREGYGFTNSCKVDTDSDLRFKSSLLTNDKGRTQLFARTFQATPNLFRGTIEPQVESKLIQGEYYGHEKSCLKTTEQPFDTFIPLITCLKDNVQNPNNIIPEWKWGGEGTRDTVKQKEFLEKNGYNHDGENWFKRQCQ